MSRRCSAREDAAGQPVLRRAAAALAATLTICACAAGPQAGVPPVAAPISRLQVEGAAGATAPAAALRQVAAEGRAALARHHLQVMAGLDGGTLYRGNAAALLIDGPATFAAMKAAIEGARHRVLLESYIVEERGVAAQIADLLLERAGTGVSVALLYDAIGSIGTPEALFERLRAGGVAVCAFNPATPQGRGQRWTLDERDHRKLLVVDNDVGFTGGINISSVYGSGSFSVRRSGGRIDPLKEGWRDTQIALRGPVVPALAATFVQAWRAQRCAGGLRDAPPAAVPEPGKRHVKVLRHDPESAGNPIYEHLLAAVGAARSEVLLTMAYFAPGREAIDALTAAARRGVKVVLLMPGRSDAKLVLHAGRSHYDELLAAGVQIHEMRDALLHAKTAVIDGVWSTVGSSNLDRRSIDANHELNVVLIGEDFAGQLRALFDRDREASQPVTPQGRARRGLGDRLLELLGWLAERWL